MRVCYRNYSGRRGVYSKLLPEYFSLKALQSYLLTSSPIVDVFSAQHNSHITVMCSELLPVRSVKLLPFPKSPIACSIKEAQYWPGDNGKGFIVLIMQASRELQHLHQVFVHHRCVHKYQVFTPHITIGSNLGDYSPRIAGWLRRLNSLVGDMPLLTFNRMKLQDVQF